MPCQFCGRQNDDDAVACRDCGKPLRPSAARVQAAISSPSALGAPAAGAAAAAGRTSPPVDGRQSTPVRSSPSSPSAPVAACSTCSKPVDPALPFCPHCGARVQAATRPSGTAVLSAASRVIGPKLALLDDDGSVIRTVTLDRAETVIGRADADLVFADDVFLSPVHAQFTWREGQLSVRDLGSRNGTWLFVEQPVRLTDGDVMLIGSQLVRFRRLGYPGPHPPEADQTRRLGSLIPTADVAVLAQLRGDGSTRDTLHLSPGRSVKVGRVEGDWVFPYDQTMSSRHAEVVSVDGDFYLQDQGSRNGVALSVRGERAVIAGQRVLMGDQLFRVESL